MKDLIFDGIIFHDFDDWFTLGFGHQVIWHDGYWHLFECGLFSVCWHFEGNYK